MPPQTNKYLTTKELADLLRIKERKVYDLASSGEIPCSRALGKLLFPRAAVEAWIARHGTDGAELATTRPNLFLGSHDPLLEWAISESRCGMAIQIDSSFDGLERFARAEGAATGLHIFTAETEEWNRPSVEARFAHDRVVLAEWAWRERGLIVAADNPRGIEAIENLKGLKLVPRQAESGSQVLLDHLLAKAGLTAADLAVTDAVRSETEAALAVLEGRMASINTAARSRCCTIRAST